MQQSDPAGATANLPLIAFDRVTKRFGSTEALSSVTFDGLPGSIHAVTGENGAGKSTLMKMLAGVHRTDAGEIRLSGRQLLLGSPEAALKSGISTVFQELTLLPNLTIAENLFLGREPRKWGLVDGAKMRTEARRVLSAISTDLDPDVLCGDLTVSQQQLVEIAKGMTVEAKVFIFDEPTAALSGPEVRKLENLIRDLRTQNKLVFYISHRLDEIFRFCDRVTVLKDGRHVKTLAIGEIDRDGLVTLMVGRELGQLYPKRGAASPSVQAALGVRKLVVAPSRPVVSCEVRRGEITGLAGLEGQGQRDIIRTIAGLSRPLSGDLTKFGPNADAETTLAPNVVSTALAGVGFIPEDRKSEGLYLTLSIAQNIALGMFRNRSLWQRAGVDRARISSLIASMRIRARTTAQTVGSLSGGNQQKVMIGRWLASGVDVLLIEEPTRGVDVGAKAEIYALLREFADAGGAVLITSSELTEHLGLCDRILVVRDGAIVTDLPGPQASEATILRHALISPQVDPEASA